MEEPKIKWEIKAVASAVNKKISNYDDFMDNVVYSSNGTDENNCDGEYTTGGSTYPGYDHVYIGDPPPDQAPYIGDPIPNSGGITPGNPPNWTWPGGTPAPKNPNQPAQAPPQYPYSTGTGTWKIEPKWPEDLPNAIGLIYIKDKKVMLRNEKGEDIVVADLKDEDNEVVVNLMAVIAKTVLEKSIEGHEDK